MKVELKNKNVNARIDHVRDFLDGKTALIVTTVLQKVETQVGEELTLVEQRYDINIPFSFVDNNWTDADVVAYAKEQLDKRYGE